MNWYKISQFNYPRVKAKDYFQLMRELNNGNRNLPLLNKMIRDLEPAIMHIWFNTVAMGHTAHNMEYPCPECNSGIFRFEDYINGDIDIMMHSEDPDFDEFFDDEIINEEKQKNHWGGFFMCPQCHKIMTFDEVEKDIEDPTGYEFHSRGSLMSDQIEKIFDLFSKAQKGNTFEEKFPYFEAIIQYVHGSGGISHFFIEGGESTIDKYRQYNVY